MMSHCQTCGACCASFRVDFSVTELQENGGVVPDGLADVINDHTARLRGTDERMTLPSVRLMRAEADVDCTKAHRELGWQPAPVQESVREAARFWAGMREARRKARA